MILRKSRNEAGEVEQPMRIRIKRHAGAGGPVELKISGSANTGDIEALRNAIDHFEKEPSMKCYIDLGKVRHLCSAAIGEITGLRRRITERGDMFDVVDISVEAELEIRSMGLQNVIRPLYPWPYAATGA